MWALDFVVFHGALLTLSVVGFGHVSSSYNSCYLMGPAPVQMSFLDSAQEQDDTMIKNTSLSGGTLSKSLMMDIVDSGSATCFIQLAFWGVIGVSVNGFCKCFFF